MEVGVASGAGRGSVVATDEHPFWAESEKRWSHAVDLRAGHRLETGDHRDVTVTGTRSWSEVRRVYNLTVDSDHTYFVVAGQTPVLTHNCGGGKDASGAKCACPSRRPTTWRLDAVDHPGSSIHGAEQGGDGLMVTIDRPGASNRRAANLDGIPAISSFDRDLDDEGWDSTNFVGWVDASVRKDARLPR
ncbi:polymorphic toxin-type HINT domain-containing protein [Amycolatopsis sp. WAC 04169]|uniref:polymorphic toxin-type HINT domain-containing protein n=1 Tax=Amycolatopsis sp. WAC 04169 TaxID=2203197 RepID=UPI0013157CF9